MRDGGRLSRAPRLLSASLARKNARKMREKIASVVLARSVAIRVN